MTGSRASPSPSSISPISSSCGAGLMSWQPHTWPFGLQFVPVFALQRGVKHPATLAASPWVPVSMLKSANGQDTDRVFLLTAPARTRTSWLHPCFDVVMTPLFWYIYIHMSVWTWFVSSDNTFHVKYGDKTLAFLGCPILRQTQIYIHIYTLYTPTNGFNPGFLVGCSITNGLLFVFGNTTWFLVVLR